jgi:hypothetical protein
MQATRMMGVARIQSRRWRSLKVGVRPGIKGRVTEPLGEFVGIGFEAAAEGRVEDVGGAEAERRLLGLFGEPLDFEIIIEVYPTLAT